MERPTTNNPLLEMCDALYAAYGPQHWWPADSAVEVAIGAILTQNTAWKNVEKAIAAMKTAGCLDFRRIDEMNAAELAEVIRPAGTYRVKAARLKAFANWLMTEHGGSLPTPGTSSDPGELRPALLRIPGVGPETADAILLYACGYATFVVDAYTKRVLRRHGLIDSRATYDYVKSLLEDALPRDVQMYNEYHALFVEVGKRHCKARADCNGCPLERWSHNKTA